MKSLKLLYTLIVSLTFAMVFGMLIGGGDSELTQVATLISFVGGAILSYGYSPKTAEGMLFTGCSAITSGATFDCSNPISSGVVATFYLANKSDIASITYDGSNPMLATDITMVATKKFYVFEGQLQSTEPKFAMIKGKYVNQFEHSLGYLVFNLSPTVKEEILNMKDGNFVAIVENNYTGTSGNAKFEIYGGQSGLKAEVIERNPNDAENLGAYKLELKTQEYARESKPPITLFDTDLATTDSLVASLIV